MQDFKLSVIVPIYNEEEVLPRSYERFKKALDALACRYELIYIDDGSADDSFIILEDICAKDERVKALRFSRNFGHQLAVTAGMDEADGDFADFF